MRSSLLRPASWKHAWSSYNVNERKHVALYVAGMMIYKLGYEVFVGAMTTLALHRWGGDERYGKLGALHGLNMLFQCVGSILSSLVLRRRPAPVALAAIVLMFALTPTIIIIADVATGGRLKGSEVRDIVLGTWSTDALFPLYCLSGICYGMVELVRRVIPRSIIGSDIDKLRQIDSVVHIFYEAAGTAGAFFSSYLVLRLGGVFSMIVVPVCFGCAATFWKFMGPLSFQPEPELEGTSFFQDLKHVFLDFFRAIYLGGRIIFTHRQFCWLPIGYSLALYAHRYLENGILPMVAQGYLNEPAYTQILVGGSNLGELLGALAVLLAGNLSPTPIPWLRLDAVLLALIWYLPFYKPPGSHGALEDGHSLDVSYAWKLTPILMPISLAWSAGDVSLVAFIQSSLDEGGAKPRISSLGAVMAFLYSTYIVFFAIMTPALGKYADDTSSVGAHDTVFNLGGIQYTVIAVVLLLSTLMPQGALSWNPKLLGGMYKTSPQSKSVEEDGYLDADDDVEVTHGFSERAVERGAGPTVVTREEAPG